MMKRWLTVVLLLALGLAAARGLDDAFVRIATLDIPGFAAVYLDDDQQGFVVALVPERVRKPVNLIRYYREPFGAELPLSRREKRALWNVILPRLRAVTDHPLLTPDARVRFVVARYSYDQLKGWVELISSRTLFMRKGDPLKIEPIAPCDFIYGIGYDDIENQVGLDIRCSTPDPAALQPVREDLLSKLERAGVPRDAVAFHFTLELPTDAGGGR